jgi:SAM-dependent methyltransferase
MNEAARAALIAALEGITAQDHAGAWSHCAEAVGADPGARLPPALLSYLELAAGGRAGEIIYQEPSAFESFIDGGDNPALYRSAIDALHRVSDRPDSVLDIGCGDGRVTQATVGTGTRRVHLVEPSAPMLDDAQAALAAPGRPALEITSTNGGIEVLVIAPGEPSWELAQSTWAFHAVHPDVRPSALTWLAARVETLAIVEFDLPPFADRSREHATYAVDRYERGLAEYGTDSAAVPGFLMPVLVGQFDTSASRHTWEQPVEAWCDDLARAGFADVTNRQIHDYWWGMAHLITGAGRLMSGNEPVG